MKVKKLSCIYLDWELENLILGNVNLIVGKNSAGKSKTLQIIDLLVKMITQRRELDWGAQWEILFENDKGEAIRYEFRTGFESKKITYEKIFLDDILVLARDVKENSAWIKNNITQDKETVYPPENKLVIHTNRDVKKFPFLEEIANWAQQSYGFKFGNISPYSLFNKQQYDLLTSVEEIPTLWSSLKPEDKEAILLDFNDLGYEVKNISLLDNVKMPIMLVKEKGIEKRIPHFNLSQGMFRALALIVYIRYLVSQKNPATIIIDDLGEGLDSSRATKLGKFLFSICPQNNIQLIVTSNDSFLMDVVDIKYWNVLIRDGKTVHAINAYSSPELFNDFKFTGLSNFDFFSSNYIQSVQK